MVQIYIFLIIEWFNWTTWTTYNRATESLIDIVIFYLQLRSQILQLDDKIGTLNIVSSKTLKQQKLFYQLNYFPWVRLNAQFEFLILEGL